MKNPFNYSKFVTGPSFCNRKEEQKNLLEFIQASQNVLLYSHRRTGKSSLIKQVFQNIKDRHLDIGTVYVDLYGTTGEKEFITKVFQQLNALESNMDKLLKLLKNSIHNFSLQINVDPATNTPSITPSFKAVEETTILNSLMDLLENFSKKKPLVIAFDEFQEVAKYSNATSFEKRLRSFIQQHSNICYVFSGSQQHLLTAMFQSKNRAFYQQAASFPLKEIKTSHFVPWVDNIFQKGNLKIGSDHLKIIIERFKNHPMYIQLFCFFLWRELRDNPWDNKMIDKIENLIIEQKQLEYQILWDTLSINQKKVLKLILHNNGQNLFSADSLLAENLKSPSSVTRCLKSLSEKEIIIKNGKYEIQDILLKRWLLKSQI